MKAVTVESWGWVELDDAQQSTPTLHDINKMQLQNQRDAAVYDPLAVYRIVLCCIGVGCQNNCLLIIVSMHGMVGKQVGVWPFGYHFNICGPT